MHHPDMPVSFANELHDTPSMPRSYGYSAWAEGDKAVYINDRYDVWQIDRFRTDTPGGDERTGRRQRDHLPDSKAGLCRISSRRKKAGKRDHQTRCDCVFLGI